MADTVVSRGLDVERIRADFPILQRRIGNQPLVYLDSAATSQKPSAVLEAVDDYYRTSNANVHRGVHTLASEATDLYELARQRIARFIDAAPEGIVFVRNTTEALNLVASSFARELLSPGDRIVLTVSEHHSNLVPWQLAAERGRMELAFLDITDDGLLNLDALDELLAPPTKLISLSHLSNVLGTITNVAEVARRAHAAGVLVCVDAAQSVPHMPVSVRQLDVDFLAFSGHKMCGPMGTGVLWARPELLERMPPFLAGGSMIGRVTLERTTWNTVPHKFEAGTPDVAGAIGLHAACDYLDAVGLELHPRTRAIAHPSPPRRPGRGGRGDRVRTSRSDRPRRSRELQRGGCARARRRHHPGSPWRRGPRGSSLRAAADAKAWCARDRTCVAVPLQHTHGDRCAGSRSQRRAQDLPGVANPLHGLTLAHRERKRQLLGRADKVSARR